MKHFDMRRDRAEPITRFGASGVSSIKGAEGSGDGHVYTLYFQSGGQIGRHPAGPAQLFLVVEGSGWVEGGDGIRRAVEMGEATYFAPGESHAKGSETGMTAVMIQLDRLDPVAPAREL